MPIRTPAIVSLAFLLGVGTGVVGILPLTVHAQATYASVVLADTPLAYWRLGDAVSSTTAADTSGNGHTGTVHGGVTFGTAGAVNGDPNTAATLNGSTGYISNADAALRTSFNQFSVEAWVQPTNSAANKKLVSNALPGTTFTGYTMYEKNGGTDLFCSFGLGSSQSPSVDIASINLTTQLNQVVCTFDGSTIRGYLNGAVKAPTTAASGTIGASAGPTTIGVTPTPLGAYDDGVVDEVSIYNYTLTPTQISEHYNTAVAAAPVPAVTAVSPTSGPTAGGTSVVVTGTGFSAASAVKFGVTAASSYSVNSDTQITATTAAEAAATIDIRITTLGGTSPIVTADHFTFAAPGSLTMTLASPTISFGSMVGGTTNTIAVGVITYTNSLGDGIGWNTAVVATSLTSGVHTLNQSSLTLHSESSVFSPVGPTKGVATTFSGATPVTVMTGTLAQQGTYTQTGILLTAVVPFATFASATPYAGTLTYTISG